jgi:hypothetical protein
MTVVALLKSTVARESEEQARLTRTSVYLRARLRICGADIEYPITIKDLSSGGLRATVDASLFSGTKLEVAIPKIGCVPGEVVWASDGMIGVKFAKFINPDLVRTQVTGSYAASASLKPSVLRRV